FLSATLLGLAVPVLAAPRDLGPLPADGVVVFHNTSDTPGNAAVRLHTVQGIAGTWRARVPAHGVASVEINAIAAGAQFSVEADAGFAGYVQPLVKDTASGMVVNRSSCVTDSAAALHTAAGIKATSESSLRIESFGAAQQTPVLSVYDASGAV